MDAPTIRENLSTKFLYDKATAGSPSVGEVPLGGLDALAGSISGAGTAGSSSATGCSSVPWARSSGPWKGRAGGVVRGVEPPAGGHFVVYNQEFKTVLAHMTEFFLRHLGPRPAA